MTSSSLKNYTGWFVPAEENSDSEAMAYQDFQKHVACGIGSVTVNIPDQFDGADRLDLVIFYSDVAMTKPLEAPVNTRVSCMYDIPIHGDVLLAVKAKDGGDYEVLHPLKWNYLIEDCDFYPVMRAKGNIKELERKSNLCSLQ